MPLTQPSNLRKKAMNKQMELFGTPTVVDHIVPIKLRELAYRMGQGRKRPEPVVHEPKIEPSIGMKFDNGKLDYTLLPWGSLDEVVKVLEFGAKKYARDNWKNVENAEARYLAAAFRHMVQYNNGEANDSETGLSHLAHATCCLLFIMGLEDTDGTNT
jgi:hypothetical protein